MTEADRENKRLATLIKAVLDGRKPSDASVLVTLESVVTGILLLHMRDFRKAAQMLNEGLVPGVESRLAMAEARQSETRP